MLYKKISELPSGVVAADGDLLEISRQLTDAKKSYSISVSAVYDNFSAKIKPTLDDKISGSIYQNPDTNDGTGIGLHWQGNGGAGGEGLPNFQYFLISDKTKKPAFDNLITKTYFEKYTKDFVTSENVPKPDLSEYATKSDVETITPKVKSKSLVIGDYIRNYGMAELDLDNGTTITFETPFKKGIYAYGAIHGVDPSIKKYPDYLMGGAVKDLNSISFFGLKASSTAAEGGIFFSWFAEGE